MLLTSLVLTFLDMEPAQIRLYCRELPIKHSTWKRGYFNNPSLNPFFKYFFRIFFLILIYKSCSLLWNVKYCHVTYFLEIKEMYIVHAWNICSKPENVQF
jgi:hypothetical protein